jgi:hypothetical protein
VVAALATNATVIAIAISSIIPGLRARSSLQPPTRNGRPPYEKTIVPRTAGTRSEPEKGGAVKRSQSWIISL